jgi:UDP-N-acetylglucosamine:LPS N-acetylglucosamine transferase
MNSDPKIRTSFLFASQGIGGAEQSMARLMEILHPHRAICHVMLIGTQNPPFYKLLDALGVSCTHISLCGWFTLGRTLRAHKANIAYLFGNLRVIPWAWVARLSRVPVIIAAERSIPTGRLKIIGRCIDRYFVDGYICKSKVAQAKYASRVARLTAIFYQDVLCCERKEWR